MTNKLTNAKALAFVLENFDLPTDIREKIEGIKAQIEKRNASKSSKPTKEQRANAEIKAVIVEVLSDNTARTVTEIMGLVPALANASNQKASALVNQLVKEGVLKREEIKRKAYFSIA